MWEAIADPATQGLGNFTMVVDLNRQSLDRVIPDIAAVRLKRFFADAGWHVAEAKYGAPADGRVRASPAGTRCEAHIDAMPNEAYQELFALARPRRATQVPGRRRSDAVAPIRRRPRRRRARRRSSPTSAATTSGCCIDTFRACDADRRPAVGGVRLHDQGARPADGRRPDEPRRAAQRPSRSTRSAIGARPRRGHRVGPLRPRLRRRPAVSRGRRRHQQRATGPTSDPAGPRRRPPDRAPGDRSRPRRRSAGCSPASPTSTASASAS